MDPITDMLNRIKNAQAVSKPTVEVPFSKIKFEIAKILESNKFIEKAEKRGRGQKKNIKATLRYEQGVPAILGLKRISKQGQRIYEKVKKIKSSRSGYGIYIISTPKGVMTNKEARKQRLGGEVICEVW